jgi:hypothetical protein
VREPSPRAEQLSRALTELADARLARSTGRAGAILARIREPVMDVERRVGVPRSRIVGIYRRDCWTCRYCGVQTIPLPILRVLHPEQLPDPAYLLVSSSVDHLVPGSRGGHWTDAGNLLCACWACNAAKAHFTVAELGWRVLDVAAVASDWDGLTEKYAELWRMAGEPDPDYHRPWLRVLTADP